HHDVEQDQVGGRRMDALERLQAVACTLDIISPRLESGAQELDVVFVIVDYQNAAGRLRVFMRRHHGRGTSALPRPPHAARRVWRGIRRIRPPWPSRDRTPTRAR